MRKSNSSGRPTVALFVGGWSPGPLIYLGSTLASRQIPIIEPRSLPMPPFPGTWCCHPKTLIMLVVVGFFLWLTFTPLLHWGWNVVAGIMALAMMRVLASVVVYTSIQVGGASCLEAIRPYQQDDEDESIVYVGFSWGGAVLAELLAQKQLGDQPRVLLIAPTTSLVASIIGFGAKDAALRIDDPNIQVVHGSADLAFCPHQSRWTGVNLHTLRDNHIFFHPDSQRRLKDVLRELVERDTATDLYA